MTSSDLSLTSEIRSSLLSLRDTSARIARTHQRLATGKKVNSALDNPTSFFAAQSLLSLASDLDDLHGAIGQAIGALKATANGLDGVTSLLLGMKSLVDAAGATSGMAAKKLLAGSFDQAYAQLNSLVRDTSYQGTNLIADSGADPLAVTCADLSVPLNARGTSRYLVAGSFMGARCVLHETPGGQPAWVADDSGEVLTGYGASSGSSVGNLSNVSLVIRFSPQADSLGDLNHNGVLQAGEGTEIDFRLANTSAAAATGVSFSNAALSTGWNFLHNKSSVFGNVAAGQTVITNNATDLDLNIPHGTDGTQFSITLDFTSDGVTRKLSFGPLTVGSITNGQVLPGAPVVAPSSKPTVATDSLKLDQADYRNGVFQVVFPGPPPQLKTLYAEKLGLPVYHSWAYGGFQSQAGIDAAKEDIFRALSMVRGYADAIGAGSDIVVIRSEFNDSIAQASRTGAEGLTLADMHEEGANALMLQLRQQLAVSSLGVAGTAAADLLKLMG